MDIKEKALEFHRKQKGKIEICGKSPVKNLSDLAIQYTPGVAAVSQAIARDESFAWKLTIKQNTVAIVSDGTAVLGLGNIGPKAALPVMEGKALILKQFSGLNAFPLVLATTDPDEIIQTVKNIHPAFGAIILEDIAAPACFIIEKSLQDLEIPVVHDDQHGTATVVLAALINALKIVKKNSKDIKIVINGAGAAGIAIGKAIHHHFSTAEIIFVDSRGIICSGRSHLGTFKKDLLKFSNKRNIQGKLEDALKKTDVFIGVSKGNLLNENHIKSMNQNPIIFALANPIPEIHPLIAEKAGAAVIATGRSDFKNQVNNALAFPGIFKGLLSVQARGINQKTLESAAIALAGIIKTPKKDKILPSIMDKSVVETIASAVAKSSIAQNLANKK